jgi:hypothetical protein
MAEAQLAAVGLFADGLSLVYHEARHVRFLVKADYVPAGGWERLISLPKNRVEAWKQLQPIRQAARRKSTAREAATVFQKRFGPSLKNLDQLYENANWKHASAVGGHAWRNVTAMVSALGEAIDRQDQAGIDRASADLLQARHNTGKDP